jgi:hypothetical protein
MRRSGCHLIPYGIALKAAYCSLAFYYWLMTGIPGMWKTFALVDLAMGLACLWVYARDS